MYKVVIKYIHTFYMKYFSLDISGSSVEHIILCFAQYQEEQVPTGKGKKSCRVEKATPDQVEQSSTVLGTSTTHIHL